MQRLLTERVDFTIGKVLGLRPIRLEVAYSKEALCPECAGTENRIKSSFW